MSLDNLINQRIGLGKYQLQSFLVLCLVDINDGVQLVLSSFLNPIIKELYRNGQSYISTMASIFYVGIFFGSVLSGYLADIYGRKKLVSIGSVTSIVISICFYLVFDIYSMLILRFLYGFSFGFTVAVTTSLLAETIPQKYRGKGILLLNFCISFGKVYGVIIGYIFLHQNLIEGNWKGMMLCGSIPNIIVLIGSFTILKQSPRFLISQKKYEEAFQILNYILKENEAIGQMNQQQKESIKEQNEIVLENETDLSYSSLFQKQSFVTTTSLIVCWFILNFGFYGQLTIEAYNLKSTGTNSSNINFGKYLITVAGEIPSLILSIFLIDHPSFGRKNSMTMFFIIAAIFHFIYSLNFLVIFGALTRFFMKDVFCIIYPLTTQSFKTRMRAKGFGFCSACGRIGAIVMPFIIFPLNDWKKGSVYICFSLMFFVAGIVCHCYVMETMNKNLEGEEKNLIQLRQIGQ